MGRRGHIQKEREREIEENGRAFYNPALDVIVCCHCSCMCTAAIDIIFHVGASSGRAVVIASNGRIVLSNAAQLCVVYVVVISQQQQQQNTTFT